MILFDYGQTLIAEEGFDGLKGTEAILAHASRNKYQVTPQQLQEEANAINRELGRRDPALSLYGIKVPWILSRPSPLRMCCKYRIGPSSRQS